MSTHPDAFGFARGGTFMRRRVAAISCVDEPLFEELEPRQFMAADLLISSISLAPAGPYVVGGSVTAQVVYRNAGNAASNPATIRFVISPDAVYGNADDIEVFPAATGQSDVLVSLPAGTTVPGAATIVTLPAGTTSGLYYVIGHLNTSGDGNTVNDTYIYPTRITINAPAPAPELSVTTTLTGGRFQPDQTFGGTVTVRNNGSAATTGTTVVQYVLSVDAVWGNADDLGVATFTGSNFNSITAGGVSEAPFSIGIPLFTPLGTYRLLAFVDPGHTIGETNEANNAYAYPVANIVIARPDFVGTIAGPATVTTGTMFTPTVTIRNAGGFASNPAHYQIALRPVGAVNGSTDVVLLGGGSIPGLAAGTSATNVTGQIAASATVPAGVYRMVLILDSSADVTEGNELNNTVVEAGTTTVINPGTATLPDLRLAVMPITATVLPGGTLNPFFVRVSNLGTAPNAAFIGRIYLSSNAALDPSDILISGYEADPLSTTAEFNLSAVIPTWVSGGIYYMIADVDTNQEVAEANEANNTGATAFASITIIRPTVSIVATDPAAGETTAPAVANPGVFMVSRTGPTTGPLTINYTVGGTATSAADYAALSGTVTIPAGATSAPITLNVVDDNIGDSGENVILQLARGVGYSINLALNRATVTIAENEPTVTVVATDPIGTEVAAPGIQDGIAFRFTRTGPTGAPLTITYNNGGTSDGGDRTGLLGTAIIPAGQSSVTVNGVVIDDAIGEPAETMIVTLVSGTGYAAGAAASATATINDNEPRVTVVAIDPTAAQTREGETVNNGQVRFTRTGSTGAPLTVHYELSGSADNGDDYAPGAPLTGAIVIPAGQTSVTLDIVPQHGDQVFPSAIARTVIVSVDSGGEPYGVTTTNTPATVTILSLPAVNLFATQITFTAATISLAAPNQHTPFTYRVTRQGLTGNIPAFSVQIRLTANGILGDGDDLILMTRPYEVNFTGTRTENLVIDWDLYPLVPLGFYNLGLFVDSGGVVSEYNEVDNRLISSGQVQFTP